MLLLRDERLANRVTVGLLAAIGLVTCAWVLGRLAAPAAPAPAAVDYFGELAARGTARLDARIQALQARLKAQPEDWAAYAQLGSAYLLMARETADPAYYSRAEAALEQADQHQPGDYATLASLGELALARHDFAQALALGAQARDLNPQRSLAYGIIADAQIELGRYAEAASTLQTMVDLRPDLSAYSRIAYLRELHGDVAGALEAMQMAVDAGGPTAESSAWTRTQLGHLYFNSGDLSAAEVEYQRTLALAPGYPHAQAGLARARAAQGRFDEAIELYRTATAQAPLPEYVIALGEVYTASGQEAQAQAQYELARALDQLQRANGINTDLELALFLADHGSAAEQVEAVQRAREAYAQRPTLFAADVLAWALYRTGQYTEAQPYAQAALRLGTQDALRLFHAGMIAYRLGQLEAAHDSLEGALNINPYFSLRYAPEARRILDTLSPASERSPR